jgi:transposase
MNRNPQRIPPIPDRVTPTTMARRGSRSWTTGCAAAGRQAGDFAPLLGVSKHTLYAWKNRCEAEGPARLMDRQRGAKQRSRLPETTKRAIQMMKGLNPDWGVDRMSDLLLRNAGLQASFSAIATVLAEDG